MVCKKCGLEMAIVMVERTEDKETFHYGCRNPKCSNFAFSKEVKNEKEGS